MLFYSFHNVVINSKFCGNCVSQYAFAFCADKDDAAINDDPTNASFSTF